MGHGVTKMQFKINEIGPEGLPVNVLVTAEWLASACPDLEAKPGQAGLALQGRIHKTGEDYLLRAHVQGALELPCARCLEPARFALDLPITVTFVPAGRGEPADSDDPDVVVFPGGEIDISDEVRDEILLAVPINPLCTETCRGICSVCGGDRNQVACTCEADAAARSGRLGALADIKL
jgi:uncharacterized metal-binding protein YceD (DUF177 family)